MLIGTFSTFLPQVEAVAVADSGAATVPNPEDNNAFAFSSSLYHIDVTNNLIAFGFDGSYRFPYYLQAFGKLVEESANIALFDTYATSGYDWFVQYNGSNLKLLRGFTTKTKTLNRDDKDCIEFLVTYTDATYPLTVKSYYRISTRQPILNLTFVIEGGNSATTYELELGACYARPTDNGQYEWSGIYVPNIGWKNYSSPASSQWTQIINSSNIASWNDNYLIPYMDTTSKIDQPFVAFVNRTQISYVEMYEDNTIGNVTKLRFRTGNGNNNIFTYYLGYVANTTVTDINALSSKVADFAHMAVTQPSLSYTLQSQTADAQTWKVSASFTDNPHIDGWSITANTSLPTFFNGTWSSGSFYGIFGYVNYVPNGTNFVVPRSKGTTWDTGTALSYASNFVNNLASNNFWVSTQYATGFRQSKGSNAIGMNDALAVMWALYEYYQITQDTSAFEAEAKSFLDWMITYQQADGSLPFAKIDSSNNSTSGTDQGINMLSWILGYRMFGNSSYLEAAKKSADYYYTNNASTLSSYRFDIQTVALLNLYDITGNATYLNWIKQYIEWAYDSSRHYSSVADDTELFGHDISTHAHTLKGFLYILLQEGEITSHNLAESVRRGLNYAIKQRDIYGSQVLSVKARYPLYPCHQQFVGNAYWLYFKYLRTQGLFNRTYYRLGLENFKWIDGNNEKGYDFIDEAAGEVGRSIRVSGGVPTLDTSNVAYDQAEIIISLVRMSQIQNWVFAYDNGERYSSSEVRVESSTAMISGYSLTPTELTLTLTAPSGTTTTYVYCGDKGEPTSVSGASSWNYDSNTKICTITVTHSSSKKVELTWGGLRTRALTVTSLPITGITFTVNGVPQTTPYTEWLLEDSYTLIMQETHDGYVWSHWLEDGDTNRIKTVTIDTNITLTAVLTPDTTPPTISIISPENKTYPVNDVPLTFTVSESTSWISYSLDGQAKVTITGNITLSDLSDRSHYVVVYANDTVGNMGVSSTVYFAIDTTPPVITILSPQNKTYSTSSVPLTFTLDELTSWIGYSLDDQGNVTITGNTTLSGLSDGSHSLIVYAKDTAGNTGASEIIYFSISIPQFEAFPWWILGPSVMVIIGIAVAVTILWRRRK